MDVRPTAVAGRFYDANTEQLQRHVSQLMSPFLGKERFTPNEQLVGLIVPHAGYLFSGATAASGYAILKARTPPFKRVLLVGPNHRVAFQGCALPSHHYFATPLGTVPLDTDAIEQLASDPHCHYLDHAHAQEHSLEVQIPFLQACLKDFKLIPLLTGSIDPTSVAKLIAPLWDKSTLLVISSDLSHFHDYETCQRIDNNSCNKIEMGQPLISQEACGYIGINAANEIIKQQQCHLQRLSLCNSGDTPHGDKNRVVGYVSYAISR
ncbi:AmmeMemoRadiSam system protein B [Vibrio sp. 10N]|uniref:AmmeMemoRadiSam system protein B n=1 Tax=Vibrio sp. 10N TaxID=3058938 RepID=UPI00281341EF|nr:hypothetical protein VB10N_35270 [Vibrio sp. 10N]